VKTVDRRSYESGDVELDVEGTARDVVLGPSSAAGSRGRVMVVAVCVVVVFLVVTSRCAGSGKPGVPSSSASTLVPSGSTSGELQRPSTTVEPQIGTQLPAPVAAAPIVPFSDAFVGPMAGRTTSTPGEWVGPILPFGEPTGLDVYVSLSLVDFGAVDVSTPSVVHVVVYDIDTGKWRTITNRNGPNGPFTERAGPDYIVSLNRENAFDAQGGVVLDGRPVLRVTKQGMDHVGWQAGEGRHIAPGPDDSVWFHDAEREELRLIDATGLASVTRRLPFGSELIARWVTVVPLCAVWIYGVGSSNHPASVRC
jgi:hypothetical protein